MSYPWGHKKRYNSYPEYFKKEFGERIQKVAVNAGFTCPNRDGNKSTGGCTYCTNDAFNPSYCDSRKSIAYQISEGISFYKFRYKRVKKYLVYFQPYSNTYAPIEKLRELYSEALSHPDVVGLVIGTRPDCIDEEKLLYLRELSKEYYIMLEYGIESVYNKTLERINRQHTFEESVNALTLTTQFGIRCGAHFIFGLPGESREEMMASADAISQLRLNTVKFHQLQIFKGTPMQIEFQRNPEDFTIFSKDEYFKFMGEYIQHLNPNLVIERFTSEAPPRYLAHEPWGSLRTDQIQTEFDHYLEEKNIWQGKVYTSTM